MKFNLKNNSGENITNLMRKAGYYFSGEKGKELSFIRPFGRSGYPRFHIYLSSDSQKNEIAINLHLDQKRPIYRSAAAHAGEYDGKIVEAEAERIKQIL